MTYRTCPHCGTEDQWAKSGKVLKCQVCDSMASKIRGGFAPNRQQIEEEAARIRREKHQEVIG